MRLKNPPLTATSAPAGCESWGRKRRPCWLPAIARGFRLRPSRGRSPPARRISRGLTPTRMVRRSTMRPRRIRAVIAGSERAKPWLRVGAQRQSPACPSFDAPGTGQGQALKVGGLSAQLSASRPASASASAASSVGVDHCADSAADRCHGVARRPVDRCPAPTVRPCRLALPQLLQPCRRQLRLRLPHAAGSRRGCSAMTQPPAQLHPRGFWLGTTVLALWYHSSCSAARSAAPEAQTGFQDVQWQPEAIRS